MKMTPMIENLVLTIKHHTKRTIGVLKVIKLRLSVVPVSISWLALKLYLGVECIIFSNDDNLAYMLDAEFK